MLQYSGYFFKKIFILFFYFHTVLV